MNVAASPGVYALLLGSGVSQSAGILTGWEVTLDLVRKVAAAAGSDAESDPEKWYREEYRKPPQYSALLEELAETADERQALLEGYFEPTPEERAEAIKTPTDAHRAIARMVADGWIRVIVTTNFDRLLEVALEDAGVTPVVIATAGAAGATPLAHSKCTVIKVHGDYMDPGIKNSEEELATYEPAVNTLLDQVFDEYGLVVCGWSGEYDVALRAAIARCKSRRYTTYWCTLASLGQEAKQLSQHQASRVVDIDGANSFFVELEERVTSIQRVGERHPLETLAAVETLKRYLTEDRHRIRLRELVQGATEELVSHLKEDNFSVNVQITTEEIAARVQRLNVLSERTIALVANGSFHGMPEQSDMWLKAVVRLAGVEVVNSRANRWGSLFRYPALLALYTAGISAVATEKYALLRAVLCTPLRSSQGSEAETIVQRVYPHGIVPEGAAHVLCPNPGGGRYHTPLSLYIERTLRPQFADLIPDEHDYTEAFDRYEYLASLVHADLYDSVFFAGGSFEWRRELYGHRWLPEIVGHEIDESGDDWAPLNAGLFGGSLERLREVRETVHEALRRRARW